uniref:SET domain-containing protein n=2 Tax=Opuntia streptacantha TaxID=393608 RepID=A0A7C9DDD1_OPUST
MSSVLRCSRWLSPQFKLLRSVTNPLAKFSLSFSTTTTTTNHEEESSQPRRLPIRVAFTDSAGRGVFATRRIGAGELIHTAQPLVSHPSLSKINTVCYLCLRSLKLRNDAQAVAQPYCSNECREQSKAFYVVEKKADWSTYHEYCRNQGLKYPLLVKRLACMVISGAVSADCIDILQPAYMLPAIDEEYGLLRSTFEGIHMTSEQLEFLTKQWYADVLARIRINAFRIEVIAASYKDLPSAAAASVEAEAGVGNAVYILPSFYNHDCDPNVHILWIDNTNSRLKALCDIEEGEELRICYIDASMDHQARQNVLMGGFGFKCSCHRCVEGD